MNRRHTDLRLFASPEDLASSAAAVWIKVLQSAAAGHVHVALPGGRIYKQFFQALALEAKGADALEKVHFFWGDERCVPPEHEDSNFRLANEGLFRPLGIDPARIHRVKGEEAPTVAAALAERELREVTGTNSGVPILDCIFLGMGEDGHVASLFPGETPEQIISSQVYRAVVGPKPPPNRVTISYGALAAAKQVWVLVSGNGKTGALRESLAGRATPLGRVISSRPHTVIFTDCEP